MAGLQASQSQAGASLLPSMTPAGERAGLLLTLLASNLDTATALRWVQLLSHTRHCYVDTPCRT